MLSSSLKTTFSHFAVWIAKCSVTLYFLTRQPCRELAADISDHRLTDQKGFSLVMASHGAAAKAASSKLPASDYLHPHNKHALHPQQASDDPLLITEDHGGWIPIWIQPPRSSSRPLHLRSKVQWEDTEEKFALLSLLHHVTLPVCHEITPAIVWGTWMKIYKAKKGSMRERNAPTQDLATDQLISYLQREFSPI